MDHERNDGLNTFVSIVSDFRRLFFWVVNLTALAPLSDFYLDVGPKYPKGIPVITAIVQFIVLIYVFHFWFENKQQALNKAMVVSLLFLFLSFVFYLYVKGFPVVSTYSQVEDVDKASSLAVSAVALVVFWLLPFISLTIFVAVFVILQRRNRLLNEEWLENLDVMYEEGLQLLNDEKYKEAFGKFEAIEHIKPNYRNVRLNLATARKKNISASARSLELFLWVGAMVIAPIILVFVFYNWFQYSIPYDFSKTLLYKTVRDLAEFFGISPAALGFCSGLITDFLILAHIRRKWFPRRNVDARIQVTAKQSALPQSSSETKRI